MLPCCLPRAWWCYSCRLIELCEASLVGELLRLPLPAAAAEAPHLLCLADELGLAQLRRAAVGFIAQHYADVQVSRAVPAGVCARCVPCAVLRHP